jgi:hypothetical protein
MAGLEIKLHVLTSPLDGNKWLASLCNRFIITENYKYMTKGLSRKLIVAQRLMTFLRNQSRVIKCEILGSHGGEYEDDSFVSSSAV